ncbi:MAG: PfkB family carbohydrate kinase [Thiotrichales bacterium]|nr:PfkB family carbohydrate kinase [Thiotrichales bacterium]
MSGRFEPRPVVIDTDPGIDDALAIMLALRSYELRVELMTTVAGNVGLRATTDNARRLLALLEPAPVPRLVPGASRPLRGRLTTAAEVHGDDGLAGLSRVRDARGCLLFPASLGPLPARENAADAIAAKAREHGDALTIVALGPLTNLARAIDADASAMRAVGRLIVMGGAIEAPGNVTASAEFNFHVDPEAADRVLTSGMRITLVGLDVTHQVRLRWPVVRDALRDNESSLARAIRHLMRPIDSNDGGLFLNDPLAMALAVDATLVRTRALPVRVETKGEHTRGMSIADRRRNRGAPRTGAADAAEDAPLVDVAFEVDTARVLGLMAERVLGAARPEERPADVVVVGSANTDLTVTARSLPRPGETVTEGALHTGFGGKGANQAVAARRAGAEVAFVARMGADAHAERYLEHLRAEGIDIGAISRDRRAASGVALIAVDAAGHNQIAVASGANTRLRPAHLKAGLRRVRTNTVVVAQLEVPIDTVEAAFRAARRAGATTMLNPAPVPSSTDKVPSVTSTGATAAPEGAPLVGLLPPTLVAVTDVVVVNQVEGEQLTGLSVSGVVHARRAAAALIESGFGAAVVTLGDRGAVWTDATGNGRTAAPRVKAIDTVGAGDTFVGYLASGLARGIALGDSVAEAVHAAALAVTRQGAQSGIPRRPEVARSVSAATRASGP